MPKTLEYPPLVERTDMDAPYGFRRTRQLVGDEAFDFGEVVLEPERTPYNRRGPQMDVVLAPSEARWTTDPDCQNQAMNLAGIRSRAKFSYAIIIAMLTALLSATAWTYFEWSAGGSVVGASGGFLFLIFLALAGLTLELLFGVIWLRSKAYEMIARAHDEIERQKDTNAHRWPR